MSPIIPRPVYPVEFDFVDQDLETVAVYLMTECNLTFQNILALNGSNVIKSYSTDNTARVPLSRGVYPLLKVYRNNEAFLFPVNAGGSVQISVVYVLAFNPKQVTNGLTTHVSAELRRILQNSAADDAIPFTIDMTRGIATEYNTTSPVSDVIYYYAKTVCYLLTE